jgi:hypothetical protein
MAEKRPEVHCRRIKWLDARAGRRRRSVACRPTERRRQRQVRTILIFLRPFGGDGDGVARVERGKTTGGRRRRSQRRCFDRRRRRLRQRSAACRAGRSKGLHVGSDEPRSICRRIKIGPRIGERSQRRRNIAGGRPNGGAAPSAGHPHQHPSSSGRAESVSVRRVAFLATDPARGDGSGESATSRKGDNA